MGGFNSGRRARTPNTDDCLRLSLTELRGAGVLKHGYWTRLEMRWTRYGGRQEIGRLVVRGCVACDGHPSHLRIVGLAFGQPVDQYVQLVAQPQPFGGERYFALCPITGKRCAVLYMPPGKLLFASAGGLKLPYASTRECEVDRAYRAMHKYEQRLIASPKYTRKKTIQRLLQRMEQPWAVIDEFETRLMRLDAALARSD